MNLKPTLLALALATAGGALALAPAAQAADGTITINGTVTATTCTVSAASKNITVTLPTVSTTSLSASGNTAGQTQFQISFTGCTAASTVSAFFQQGPGIDSATGNLLNAAAAGPAGKVEVQLLNSDASAINLLDTATNTTSVAVNPSASPAVTGGTLTYYARYFATGAATAGAVTATQQYTLQYN